MWMQPTLEVTSAWSSQQIDQTTVLGKGPPLYPIRGFIRA
jgi:hypothetical protein